VSRTGNTGAELFLFGLKGMSSWPKLSTKETDNLLGDISDFLGFGLWTGTAPWIPSGSGVNLCFCIRVSFTFRLLSLLVGVPSSRNVKMSLVSLTHTDGTGEGVKESNTSELVFGELSHLSQCSVYAFLCSGVGHGVVGPGEGHGVVGLGVGHGVVGPISLSVSEPLALEEEEVESFRRVFLTFRDIFEDKFLGSARLY